MAKTKTETPTLSSDALVQLTSLCQRAFTAEQEIESFTEQLKEQKELFRTLTEEDIPNYMSEIGEGIESITLTNGTAIRIKDDVYAAIPDASKEAAFAWLEKNGFGGLIKTEVLVIFGREQFEVATKFAERCTEEGLAPELERGVHNQTLRAFLREQLEKATAVPLDLFGARPVKVAKLTPPKT